MIIKFPSDGTSKTADSTAHAAFQAHRNASVSSVDPSPTAPYDLTSNTYGPEFGSMGSAGSDGTVPVSGGGGAGSDGTVPVSGGGGGESDGTVPLSCGGGGGSDSNPLPSPLLLPFLLLLLFGFLW